MIKIELDDVKACIDTAMTAIEAAAKLSIHERTYRRHRTALAMQEYSSEHDMTSMVPDDGFKVKASQPTTIRTASPACLVIHKEFGEGSRHTVHPTCCDRKGGSQLPLDPRETYG